MGSCLSCGEDDDDGRGRVPDRSTVFPYLLPTPPLTRLEPRPAPSATSLPSNYNPYRYSYSRYRIDDGASRAVQELPAIVPASRSTYVPSKPVPKHIAFTPKPGALYGQYKCGTCKNFWDSRLSWRDKYQQCRRCKAYVRPGFQRELLPSDFTSRDGAEESKVHPKELCEMCKQKGDYCGRYK